MPVVGQTAATQSRAARRLRVSARACLGRGGAAAGCRAARPALSPPRPACAPNPAYEPLIALEEEDGPVEATDADLAFIDDEGVAPEARIDFGDDEEQARTAACLSAA